MKITPIIYATHTGFGNRDDNLVGYFKGGVASIRKAEHTFSEFDWITKLLTLHPG